MPLQDLVIKNNNFNLPDFYFSSDSATLKISGRSLPENAEDVFEKPFSWLAEYLKNPKPVTKLILDLEYFNSATIKILIRLFQILMQANTQLYVEWYFYDEDSKEIIEDIKSIVSYEIKIIPKN